LGKDSARFDGKVRVEHPQMNWQSDKLTVRFGADGQVAGIVAEQDVLFKLSDEKGQTMEGRGQKAVYTYAATATTTNELVELSGNPELVTTNGIFQNDVIYLDRAHNKLVGPGNYRISAPPTLSETNIFAIPKVKSKKK
jgi:lipopolysaccharide export system protein LptA